MKVRPHEADTLVKKAAGGVLTAKQKRHRSSITPALGLPAGEGFPTQPQTT
jgi:hypothetical protein